MELLTDKRKQEAGARVKERIDLRFSKRQAQGIKIVSESLSVGLSPPSISRRKPNANGKSKLGACVARETALSHRYFWAPGGKLSQLHHQLEQTPSPAL